MKPIVVEVQTSTQALLAIKHFLTRVNNVEEKQRRKELIEFVLTTRDGVPICELVEYHYYHKREFLADVMGVKQLKAAAQVLTECGRAAHVVRLLQALPAEERYRKERLALVRRVLRRPIHEWLDGYSLDHRRSHPLMRVIKFEEEVAEVANVVLRSRNPNFALRLRQQINVPPYPSDAQFKSLKILSDKRFEQAAA